jgi:antitoxin component HigA of HigAB toxin-antitoxin module
MNGLKPIRTEAQHRAALKEIERLWDASEVLSRRRRLTLEMIRRLRDQLGIPADVLVGEPARGAR